MNIGGDARRSAVHTNRGLAYGPGPKREYFTCPHCNSGWYSEHKARKCAVSHELPKPISGYGFDEKMQPTPVSDANRPNCGVM